MVFLSSLLPVIAANRTNPPTDPSDATEQYELARKLLKGDGQPADTARAYKLMQAAAEQGNPDAIGGIGFFYLQGIEVDKDPKMAVEWFRKGAEKGSARAQFNLGRMYLDGIGVTVNENEGLACIDKASKNGLFDASMFLGRYFFFGKEGTKADPRRAYAYFAAASKTGDPDAQNFVGVILMKGHMDGGPDLKAAEEWFRKAALQGLAKAQTNLGGIIGPASPDADRRVEALSWLMLASDQGDLLAEKELRDFLPSMDPKEVDLARKKAGEFVPVPVTK